MRRFKKATAVLSVAIMAMSMFGCGKKDDDKKDKATSSDASASDVEEEEEVESLNEADYDWATTEAEPLAMEDYPTEAGEEVFSFDFEDGEARFKTYTNGGTYNLSAKDGELTAEIMSVGAVEHGCQAYWDGFALLQGCEYTYTFDVSCDVERPLEWRLQINGGDYHAYAGDHTMIGPEKQTVSVDFVMNEVSDPAPRAVFNMGKVDDMDNLTFPKHTIKIDNIKLSVKDGSNAIEIEPLPTPKTVRVNQVGYLPSDKKFVMISSDDEVFKVVNVDKNETVFVGKYGDGAYDMAFDSVLRVGEFSNVKEPGTYKIVSAPSGESYEFKIGDDIYKDIYKDVVLMLYNQRCGEKLDSAISGDFAHDACHTGNALIYDDPSAPAKDVSGGWHDAGDYGRYVVPGAKTVQDLLLTYEDFGYDSDSVGIPESGNDVPDLLDEARYELEWMFKMQNEENGGVYHKVTGLVFPETVLAVDETEQLYLSPISFAATGDFAAVMAKASVVYKKYDEEFAKKCLDAAIKAYEYMEANADMDYYKNPEEIVTGEYPDRKRTDEQLWAAAELYIATGDSSYEATIKDLLENSVQDGLGWASVGEYPLYDLAKNDKVAKDIREKSKELLLKLADKALENCKTGGLGIDMGNTFIWGSNMKVANTGMTLLMANKLSPNKDYLKFASRQRDYIFGQNAPAYCFVTGYGSLYPKGVHHRPSQVLGKVMPGMLIGGPDSALEDPYAIAVLSKLPAALCYVDNEQSYSCNEITIYWNSPLIYLMTGLGNY